MHRICSFSVFVKIPPISSKNPFTGKVHFFLISGVILPQPLFCFA